MDKVIHKYYYLNTLLFECEEGSFMHQIIEQSHALERKRATREALKCIQTGRPVKVVSKEKSKDILLNLTE